MGLMNSLSRSCETSEKHSLAELFSSCFVHFMLLNKLQHEFCCSNGCRDERGSDRPPRPRLKHQNEPQSVPERSHLVFVPRPLAPRRPNNPSPCGGFLPKWCWWNWGRKPRCPHHSRPRFLRWVFSMQRNDLWGPLCQQLMPDLHHANKTDNEILRRSRSPFVKIRVPRG